ncbi:hypothetical protein CR513_05660, partial [Mucuna pruriens]
MDCAPGRGYGEGAINCNPELTLRQAGYSMVLPPSKEAVTPFVIHDLRIREGEHLKKIRQAWKKVVRKGPEWGLQSCEASSSYNDLGFEVVESELAGLQGQSKRKWKELDSQEGEESRGAPETKRWF